jgi:hypothetical protein
MLGEYQLQNRIAEEFEALIVEVVALRLVAETRMSQCFSQ